MNAHPAQIRIWEWQAAIAENQRQTEADRAMLRLQDAFDTDLPIYGWDEPTTPEGDVRYYAVRREFSSLYPEA